MKSKVEDAATGLYRRGNAELCEERIQFRHEFGCACVETLLQRGTGSLNVLEHCARCRHRDRMPHKRSREKRNACFGERVIAVAPRSTIEYVHEGSFTGQRSNREPAAQNLAVSGHIGANAVERLRSALMQAEARHHFIEDKRSSGLQRDFPEAF